MLKIENSPSTYIGATAVALAAAAAINDARNVRVAARERERVRKSWGKVCDQFVSSFCPSQDEKLSASI